MNGFEKKMARRVWRDSWRVNFDWLWRASDSDLTVTAADFPGGTMFRSVDEAAGGPHLGTSAQMDFSAGHSGQSFSGQPVS